MMPTRAPAYHGAPAPAPLPPRPAGGGGFAARPAVQPGWARPPAIQPPAPHPRPGSRPGPVAGARDNFRCRAGDIANGRYTILSEAGRGNFARVLRARDNTNQRQVALKVLKPELRPDAEGENEVLSAIAQRDPAGQHKILRTLEPLFFWGRNPCFIFPLLGCSLSSRKFGVRRGAVTIEEVARLAAEMGGALGFLHHTCHLVHTDLKPDNILVDDASRPGLGGAWTICDLGSASFLRPGSRDRDLITTRYYRAPEVMVAKEWDHAADVFSLGCIIFEVWAGERLAPVSADRDPDHIALLERRLGDPPRGTRLPPRPRPPGHIAPLLQAGMPSELAALITSLCGWEPRARMEARAVPRHAFCRNCVARRSATPPSSPSGPRHPAPERRPSGPAPGAPHGPGPGGRQRSNTADGFAHRRPVGGAAPGGPAPFRSGTPPAFVSPDAAAAAAARRPADPLLESLHEKFPVVDLEIVEAVVEYIRIGKFNKEAGEARLEEMAKVAAPPRRATRRRRADGDGPASPLQPPQVEADAANVAGDASGPAWTCPACTFENGVGVGNCNVCGTARPEGATTWSCAACTFHNPISAAACEMCGAAKSAGAAAAAAD